MHKLDTRDENSTKLNIDYDKSPFCQAVQRSDYVCIDNEAYLDENFYKDTIKYNNHDTNELKIQYCQSKEVKQREKAYFMLKSTYFVK